MVSKVMSLGLFGIDAFGVEVEADISGGLPSFDIVGLPGAAVKESKDRVRSALKNCGFVYPVSRITVNLAPADIRKESPVYDLPILLAVLAASKQIEGSLQDYAFVGELALNGELRPVTGVLPMVIKARELGFRGIFIPEANAAEAAVVKGIAAYPAKNLFSVTRHMSGEESISPVAQAELQGAENQEELLDFADVKGQYEVKRALEIAAAGGHNILLIGPPGSGKSMLAKRLPSILPRMSFEEAIETTKIHSIAGTLPAGSHLIFQRPFRAPHHTISPAGLSGGGTIPKPGEISLAHNGVLFLDELPEFSRAAMEILRQPVENGQVTISRVNGTLTYPCTVMLVCAMNPCPCGYFGHPHKSCTCTAGAVSHYLSKVSGPLLDRLDLHVEVPPVEYTELTGGSEGESSAVIRQRVDKARRIQLERYAGTAIPCNARLTPAMMNQACPMTEGARTILKNAFDRLGFSARAYDRLLKVARTIADLEGSPMIDAPHIAEAVQYRSLDRKYWNHL